MKQLTMLLFLLSLNTKAQFTSEDTATINITGGNTDLKTYALQSLNTYEWSKHSAKLSGAYNYGESDKVRSSENWNLGLRYSLLLSKKVSVYLGELLEADRFAGIKKRYNTDLGSKYTFIENDSMNLFCELGYRYTVEKSTNTSTKDKKDSKGRAYLETSKNFKKDLIGKFWLEYLPNFSQTDDYLINLEPSITMALSSIFSMKSAYHWKYNNAPNTGIGKHDYTYTLSLITKF